ncbi:ATP-binding protein [Photobacterium chitinilyticum]|uniref:AAA family ATPase n=1 Tax=Photobacterium chitinilyticum TaxID=2485123 RepID=UPI003D0E8CFC
MTKQIQDIHVKLTHSNDPVRIESKGKNIIITGANGCGKTKFLEQLNDALVRIADVQLRASYQVLNEESQRIEIKLNRLPKTDSSVPYYKKRAKELCDEIAAAQKVDLLLNDQESFITGYNEKTFLFGFYQATRQSQIEVLQQKPSIKTLLESKADTSLSEDFGSVFEQYLVAMKRLYNDIRVDGTSEEQSDADRIDSWFTKVQKDLRELFEDDKLCLTYNRQEESYYIDQLSKTPFRFDQLSSGFSAIMCIYADLLMKVELKSIPAEELQGIVLIDEIDAHLHVSLQRKILAFFVEAFPKVQFIVTTHSPFVIQSIEDVVVYDLSLREQLENLSAFSYDAIMEGLLGVTVNSLTLEEIMDDLSDEVELGDPNPETVAKLLARLNPHEANLSDEARLLISKGKRFLCENGSKSNSTNVPQSVELIATRAKSTNTDHNDEE